MGMGSTLPPRLGILTTTLPEDRGAVRCQPLTMAWPLATMANLLREACDHVTRRALELFNAP
jgi:hypothetical protein